jgi:hypothetical protein
MMPVGMLQQQQQQQELLLPPSPIHLSNMCHFWQTMTLAIIQMSAPDKQMKMRHCLLPNEGKEGRESILS